jgi:hypothetical protein
MLARKVIYDASCGTVLPGRADEEDRGHNAQEKHGTSRFLKNQISLQHPQKLILFYAALPDDTVKRSRIHLLVVGNYDDSRRNRILLFKPDVTSFPAHNRETVPGEEL